MFFVAGSKYLGQWRVSGDDQQSQVRWGGAEEGSEEGETPAEAIWEQVILPSDWSTQTLLISDWSNRTILISDWSTGNN